MDKMMTMVHDTGMTEHDLQASRRALDKVLSNEYLLLTKTLNYHWNITGEGFISLHKLLESQYEEVKLIVDGTAERLRMLDFKVKVDLQKYTKQSFISEGNKDLNKRGMIMNLYQSHLDIICLLRAILRELASSNDFGTIDCLTEILRYHEKQMWLLKSHII